MRLTSVPLHQHALPMQHPKAATIAYAQLVLSLTKMVIVLISTNASHHHVEIWKSVRTLSVDSNVSVSKELHLVMMLNVLILTSVLRIHVPKMPFVQTLKWAVGTAVLAQEAILAMVTR